MPLGDAKETGTSGSLDVSLHTTPRNAAPSEVATVQDEVEHLITVAAQLFHVIEHEIRQLEELQSTSDARPWVQERIVFKEQLIQSSLHLDSSLHQMAHDLDRGLRMLSLAPVESCG